MTLPLPPLKLELNSFARRNLRLAAERWRRTEADMAVGIINGFLLDGVVAGKARKRQKVQAWRRRTKEATAE